MKTRKKISSAPLKTRNIMPVKYIRRIKDFLIGKAKILEKYPKKMRIT